MPAALTFAIGDIHGCRAMLDALLERCFRYAGGAAPRFVFLGDYIDRGPDSRGAVETLIDLQRSLPDRVVCLRGNHEVLLLEALAKNDMGLWLFNGADTTLSSYGVDHVAALPQEHLTWYRALTRASTRTARLASSASTTWCGCASRSFRARRTTVA
jgi:serine/threonine protein phosphatase 1